MKSEYLITEYEPRFHLSTEYSDGTVGKKGVIKLWTKNETDGTNTYLGEIYFYPKHILNTQSRGKHNPVDAWVECSCDIDDFFNILDMLRYEKPVYLGILFIKTESNNIDSVNTYLFSDKIPNK